MTPIRARVVKDGNSVAVRLPAALGLHPGDEVVLTVERVGGWPEGYFDLEPSPAFPLPDRSRHGTREARRRRLFGAKGSL